jgi:hypothetical protein
MAFTANTIYAFLSGRMAALEVPASRPGYREFIGVYPPSHEEGEGQWWAGKWWVRRFELPLALVDDYPGPDDLVESRQLHFDSRHDVEALLEKWQIDAALFDAPWKCDYPL